MSLILPLTKRLLNTTTTTSTSTLPTFLIPFLITSTATFSKITTINSTSSPSPSTSTLKFNLSSLSLPTFNLPSISSIFPEESLTSLRELLPPWVLAVPKSKTTHSAKSMRSANKSLKEQQNIVACPSCGTPKRAHHLCHDCHVDHRREYHAKAKEELASGKTLQQ